MRKRQTKQSQQLKLDLR